jgi:hypothetical protein
MSNILVFATEVSFWCLPRVKISLRPEHLGLEWHNLVNEFPQLTTQLSIVVDRY